MDPTHIGGPAIVGCIHLDPAQLMQLSGVYIWTQPGYSNPHLPSYISSTMAKYRRLQWVFTFRPSPAATFNIINVAMQIKKAKVLKVKVWSCWLHLL